MKASVAERTMDNITVVIIAFKNFKKMLKNEVDTIRGQPLTDSSERNSKCTITDEDASVKDEQGDKDNPKSLSGPSAESGIQISKLLNLKNYDLMLEDIEIQPKIASMAHMQNKRPAQTAREASTVSMRTTRNSALQNFLTNGNIVNPMSPNMA